MSQSKSLGDAPVRRDRTTRGRKKTRGAVKPKGTRSRRRKRWPIIVGASLFALLGLLAAYPLWLAASFETQSTDIVDAFPEERLRPAPVEGDTASARNILLLGSDVRGSVGDNIETIRGQRSDTILILHIPADRENMQVISVMRDSWVDVPGHGENKINSALATGGVPLVVQTLEGLLDVRIDRVAILDFEGFRGMTDALGGVTFTNPVSFRGSDNRYLYEQGEITVNGDLALEYVRERKAFRVADYQRVRNQQAFIRGLMSGLLNSETLTNPARIAALVNDVSPHVSVDSGFTLPYIASLGYELRDVRIDDVSFMTLPTTGTANIRGQSVVLLDQAELATIVEALRTDSLSSYVPPEPPL